MDTLGYDFIRHLSGVTQISLTPRIWNDLVVWYPEQFKGEIPENVDEAQSQAASQYYYDIVKSYLLAYNIPVLVETLTAGYLWGVENLHKEGLEKAPAETKHVVALMKKEITPQTGEPEKHLKL